MSTNIWRGILPTAAQVLSVTPSSITNGDVGEITVTGDDGSTAAINFTATAVATVAEMTAGFTAAWNASTNPLITPITALDMTTYVKLTADTAGRPFVPSDTSTGMSMTIATVTASSSKNDWGLAGNWSLLAVPVNTNDVFVPAGSPDILYGLDQHGVTLAGFTVQLGYTGNIGRNEGISKLALRFACTGFTYDGTGILARFDIGSSNISPTIRSSGKAVAGSHAVEMKGSNIATLNVSNADIGIATAAAGETATVGTINISGNSTVAVGTGVTLTSWNNNGGTITVGCAFTTGVNLAGTYINQGSGAVTTLTNNGTTKFGGTGTFTTAQGSGVFDKRGSTLAQTITTVKLNAGASLYDPLKKFTFSNPIQLLLCGIEDVTLRIGTDITLARA